MDGEGKERIWRQEKEKSKWRREKNGAGEDRVSGRGKRKKQGSKELVEELKEWSRGGKSKWRRVKNGAGRNK